MKRCNRCLYPETTRPYITFNDDGVCSGCVTHEEKKHINWEEREFWLKNTVEGVIDHNSDNAYDCIIPVSGGKDSCFQIHYAINVLGLKPLLVTFNHLDNSEVGIRNIENMVSHFGS